jgi:hypothetical protein
MKLEIEAKEDEMVRHGACIGANRIAYGIGWESQKERVC